MPELTVEQQCKPELTSSLLIHLEFSPMTSRDNVKCWECMLIDKIPFPSPAIIQTCLEKELKIEI
jgi:hypothetical protein